MGAQSNRKLRLKDDFARYVIGTNSAATGDWLGVTLAQPPWEPPPGPDVLRQQLLEKFSPEERRAWDEFTEAQEESEAVMRTFVDNWFAKRKEVGDASELDERALLAEFEKTRTPEFDAVEARREEMHSALESALSSEHADRLAAIHDMEDAGRTAREPPRLELKELQRYILKRVFDFGWTTERFGRFDRFSIGYNGREASKAERIGKKYQWIAYHEILALVSDRFQYRELYREEEGDKAYEGPWQKHLRDIDPSCTLRSTCGGTSWSGHTPAWWGLTRFDAACHPGHEREWVQHTGALPRVEELLSNTNPADGVRWSNAHGYFAWKQPAPADRGPTEVDRGELWYLCTGYLIRQDDAAEFMEWAETVDFWGRWMPDPAEVYSVFLGEHAWSPASRYFECQYYGDDGWTQPGHGCPVKIRTAAFQYLRESSGFDCSVDEGYTLRLPVRELVTNLDLHWSGNGADFVDGNGKLAAQDPTAQAPGPSALLLRSDLLEEFRRSTNLTLCWAVLGEKRIISGGSNGPYHPALRMSGAYVLEESGLTGFVKRVLDDPNDSPQEPRLVDTYRLPRG